VRSTLERQAAKASPRRFTGESITDFGALDRFAGITYYGHCPDCDAPVSYVGEPSCRASREACVLCPPEAANEPDAGEPMCLLCHREPARPLICRYCELAEPTPW